MYIKVVEKLIICPFKIVLYYYRTMNGSNGEIKYSPKHVYPLLGGDFYDSA